MAEDYALNLDGGCVDTCLSCRCLCISTVSHFLSINKRAWGSGHECAPLLSSVSQELGR